MAARFSWSRRRHFDIVGMGRAGELADFWTLCHPPTQSDFRTSPIYSTRVLRLKVRMIEIGPPPAQKK
jgi:hypothetical protein